MRLSGLLSSFSVVFTDGCLYDIVILLLQSWVPALSHQVQEAVSRRRRLLLATEVEARHLRWRSVLWHPECRILHRRPAPVRMTLHWSDLFWIRCKDFDLLYNMLLTCCGWLYNKLNQQSLSLIARPTSCGVSVYIELWCFIGHQYLLSSLVHRSIDKELVFLKWMKSYFLQYWWCNGSGVWHAT